MVSIKEGQHERMCIFYLYGPNLQNTFVPKDFRVWNMNWNKT